MKVLISISIFLTLLIPNLVGQSVQSKDGLDSIRLMLRVGKSSDNSFTKSKGGEIIGSFPQSDSINDSWLTNAYLELGLTTDSSLWSFGLVGEVHKNTLIEKEQNVQQLGVSVGKEFSGYKKVDGMNVLAYTIPISLTSKLSSNLIEHKETLQIIGGFTYNRLIGPSILKTQTEFPKFKSSFGKILRLSHNHNLGLAYLGTSENVLLGQFDFELNAFILSGLSNKLVNRTDLFKLQFTYQGRTEFLGKTDLDLDNYLGFQAGINVKFDKKNSIGIAYNWIQGADPLKGLSNQSYRTISAKVKLLIQ